jgi:hypothetical protein
MQRRDVLRMGAHAGLLSALGLLGAGCGSRRGSDADPPDPPTPTSAPTVPTAPATSATPVVEAAAILDAPAAERYPTGSAYGSLLGPDANGVRLPLGFSSRLLARTGDPVGPSGYEWHASPDGAGVVALADGGWIYVSNSEVLTPNKGGVGMLRFGPDGNIVNARRLLSGSTFNCSGGVTPWGTWLSCEEIERGRVFEIDPRGNQAPVTRPALGRFAHEAAAIDPAGAVVYLTEDRPDGRFYRCVLNQPGNLGQGRLQAAAVGAGGAVTWLDIPDPTGAQLETRRQVPATTAFQGAEGIWFGPQGPVFTTKLDNKIWHYNPVNSVISLVYDAATHPDPVLTGVDNLTGWPGGGALVCEDGGDLQVVGLAPDGSLHPVLQLVGHDASEVSGLAVAPARDRLYVTSLRGTDGRGMVFEITGPWALRRAIRVP